MHTSAQIGDDDMFGADPTADQPQPLAGPQLEFCGVLLRNAELRHQTARDGLHSVPVVCMELKSTTNTTARSYHVEQPFTDATRHQAEALAKSLTKGRTVTVLTPIADMRVTFPHAQSISLNQEQPAT